MNRMDTIAKLNAVVDTLEDKQVMSIYQYALEMHSFAVTKKIDSTRVELNELLGVQESYALMVGKPIQVTLDDAFVRDMKPKRLTPKRKRTRKVKK